MKNGKKPERKGLLHGLPRERQGAMMAVIMGMAALCFGLGLVAGTAGYMAARVPGPWIIGQGVIGAALAVLGLWLMARAQRVGAQAALQAELKAAKKVEAQGNREQRRHKPYTLGR